MARRVDHLRIADQRAADSEHLLLAARELIAIVAPALGNTWKEIVDACYGPRAWLHRHNEVFVHSERWKDLALLRH